MAEPDSRAQERYERAADAALAVLRVAPPLAMIVVVAALFELALARIGANGLPARLEVNELIELKRLARFPRNLAALGGIVAITAALVSYLRLPGFAPIGRRLIVAAFSGIFIPSLLVATFFPRPLLRRSLVVFGLAAANVLVTLIGMSAIRYQSGRAVRLAIGLITATSFIVLGWLGIHQLALTETGIWASAGQFLARHPATTHNVLLTMRSSGELTWLSVGVFAGFRVLRVHDPHNRAVRIAVIFGGILLGIAAILGFKEIAGHQFGNALYGSFKLEVFEEDFPSFYALPLSIGFVGAFVGLGDRDPAARQVGLGTLLWLAAGYSPFTPIQLLYLVLGAMILARAAQALDPDGPWRTRHPWLRFIPDERAGGS